MKFLADECCDIDMVRQLRKEGYNVEYIQEINPGSSDIEVLRDAFKEKRILITEDKDFGELVYRLKIPAFGIVLLRFDPLEKKDKILRMIRLANDYREKLKGNFLTVNSNNIRIKPLRK